MSWLKSQHTTRFGVAAYYMDFAGGMFLVTVPYMALSMDADSWELGLLGGVRGLSYLVACTLAALVTDRFNRKVLIALSLVGLLVTYALGATASSLWHLYGAGALWAFSLALFWPSVFAWLGDTHEPKDLPRAAGVVNLGWSVGGAVGGVFGGYLFELSPPLSFLLASVPMVAACAVMFVAPRGQGHPNREPPPGRQPGTRRELVSAWLGNVSACCLMGLTGSVFPKLGEGLGIHSSTFGALLAGAGLGRTLIFLGAMKWGARLHGWRPSAAVQIVAAAMVATVFRASSHAWIALVFAAVGVCTGVTYYRSLYKSLEGEGRRGAKSGIHEGSLLGGVLVGALGGGAIAKWQGLRMPYLVIAGLVVLLVAVQVGLAVSAERAKAKN